MNLFKQFTNPIISNRIKFMRKFLVFFIFLTGLIASAETTYPAAPEWREICPSLYLNINSDGEYVLPEKQYWADRRKSFEKSKHYCRYSYEYDLEKLSECYYFLKKSEKRKTSEFEMVQKHNHTAPQGPAHVYY